MLRSFCHLAMQSRSGQSWTFQEIARGQEVYQGLADVWGRKQGLGTLFTRDQKNGELKIKAQGYWKDDKLTGKHCQIFVRS